MPTAATPALWATPPSHWSLLLQSEFALFLVRFAKKERAALTYGELSVNSLWLAKAFIYARCRPNEPDPSPRVFSVYALFAARQLLFACGLINKAPEGRVFADEGRWDDLTKLWADALVQYSSGKTDLGTYAGHISFDLLRFRALVEALRKKA